MILQTTTLGEWIDIPQKKLIARYTGVLVHTPEIKAPMLTAAAAQYLLYEIGGRRPSLEQNSPPYLIFYDGRNNFSISPGLTKKSF